MHEPNRDVRKCTAAPVFPVSYVFIRLQGRALPSIFGDVDVCVPAGPRPMLMLDLNVGMHVPLGG
jgi:hypothetical protein